MQAFACPTPLVRTREVMDGYAVQAEEVAVGRYDLAGELYGGLLTVADAQEDSKKLGVREGGGACL